MNTVMTSPAAAELRDVDYLTYWERVARTRWGRYLTGIGERAIRKAHLMSGAPEVAVEIGCDGGRWSRMLADLGWDMVCTDIDLSTLTVCKHRLPEAMTVLVGDQAPGIPCGSQSARLLVCLEVGPVIQSSWFVPEVSRVLVGGGCLVGVFYNRYSMRGMFVHANDLRRGSFDYYRLGYAPWREQLKRQGYAIVHEEGCCWFPFPRASNSRLVPLFTTFERILGLRRLTSLSPWVIFVARKIRTI